MKRFGFLRHSRKIRIEGIDNVGFFNRCIRNNIPLKNIRWHDALESSFESEGEDAERIRKLAGNSYRLTVINESGIIPMFRSVKKNTATVAGAFLLGALIFYQSLFISEIRIDGYSSIAESELRSTLNEAGIVEGMKKQGDYSDAKGLLYSRYNRISWVSFHEKGRMLEVSIAESGDDFAVNDKPAADKPADIVAARSGIIEKIMPLEGSAKVKKGEYVNEGSVVISGKYRYQSSDYSKGDKIFTMYSHAEGSVLARVPEHITWYYEKYDRQKKVTGMTVPGIYIKIGDMEFDTDVFSRRYKVSVKKKHKLVDTVKPLPVKIYAYTLHEAHLEEYPADMEQIKRKTEAAARDHFRKRLKKNEKLADMNIEYTETAGLIRADVFAEVIEDIGREKIIQKIEKNEHRK